MTPQGSGHSPGLLPRALVIALGITPLALGMPEETSVPLPTRFLVAALWLLALAPLYRYLSLTPARRRAIPFLPLISLMYGLYYALPLTLGITDQYDQAPIDPAVDYENPVELAFLGWIAMMAGYVLLGIFVREKAPQRRPDPSRAFQLKWGLILLFGSLAVTVIRLGFSDGATFGGLLQFVASLQWLGAGLLVVLSRRGQLGGGLTLLTLAGLATSAILAIASGSVAPLVMLAAATALALWIGKPRIGAPWIIVGLTVSLFAMSLRGVVVEFRHTAWFGTIELTQRERAALMMNLLLARTARDGVLKTVTRGVSATAGRSANLDLFANVVRRTPDDVPYWNGQTYKSLVGSFVPRFLWPDKPIKGLGQEFGHRYKLLHWSNKSTSINLPILVEFYINFAMTGVVVGMLLVGGIYRLLDATVNRPRQNPFVSMFGAVLLLPLLLIESDFSLVFGGIPLTAAALFSLWWVMTRSPSIAVGASIPAAPGRRPGPLLNPGQRTPRLDSLPPRTLS